MSDVCQHILDSKQDFMSKTKTSMVSDGFPSLSLLPIYIFLLLLLSGMMVDGWVGVARDSGASDTAADFFVRNEL